MRPLRECGELGHLRRGTWPVKDEQNGVATPSAGRNTALFLARVSRYSSPGHWTEHVMNPFLWLIDTIITIYIWLLIASAVLSWLVAFSVVNVRNPIVHSIGDFLYRITEPALRPIRALLPNLGGIDVSPVILIIGLLFLERFIFWIYFRLAV
jgi:YggT family protein